MKLKIVLLMLRNMLLKLYFEICCIFIEFDTIKNYILFFYERCIQILTWAFIGNRWKERLGFIKPLKCIKKLLNEHKNYTIYKE